jgi:hypothetical protein
MAKESDINSMRFDLMFGMFCANRGAAVVGPCYNEWPIGLSVLGTLLQGETTAGVRERAHAVER